MKLYNFLGLVISIILSAVTYFATSNIFVGAGVLIGCIAFYFIFIFKKLRGYTSNVTKLHECYLFINNFLISLSVKESLNAALQATVNSVSDDFAEFMSSIEEMNPQNKILYLKKYFPFHLFSLFVDVIFLWVEEGGKILEMSSHVINEMRETEEYVTYCQSVNRRKAVEVFVLWLFSLAIVIALRIALTDFYSKLISQPVFIGAIVLLAVTVVLSMYLLVDKIVHLEIGGNNNG